jgi:elongation factor P
MPCQILFFNDRPIEVTLPNFVEKIIAETEPGARGDTATNVYKSAKIANGWEIQVLIRNRFSGGTGTRLLRPT